MGLQERHPRTSRRHPGLGARMWPLGTTKTTGRAVHTKTMCPVKPRRRISVAALVGFSLESISRFCHPELVWWKQW